MPNLEQKMEMFMWGIGCSLPRLHVLYAVWDVSLQN